MKLVYYRGKNFGDALNPYLWKSLLPNFFDDCDESIFLGIGTLLGIHEFLHQSIDTKKIIVFGAGYGYGKLPQLDTRYDIYFVRGLLTSRVLGLRDQCAISDSAILIRALDLEVYHKDYNYSYMPHWESDLLFDWEYLCKEAGINYISPQSSVSYVIEEISKSNILITEAMHGAIVADALRIPWLPVKSYNYINAFKWTDWCSSIKIRYSPYILKPLFDLNHIVDKVKKYNISDSHKIQLLRYIQMANENFCGETAIEKNIQQLNSLKNRTPFLSSDSTIEGITDNMLTMLNKLKKEYQPIHQN